MYGYSDDNACTVLTLDFFFIGCAAVKAVCFSLSLVFFFYIYYCISWFIAQHRQTHTHMLRLYLCTHHITDDAAVLLFLVSLMPFSYRWLSHCMHSTIGIMFSLWTILDLSLTWFCLVLTCIIAIAVKSTKRIYCTHTHTVCTAQCAEENESRCKKIQQSTFYMRSACLPACFCFVLLECHDMNRCYSCF